METAESVRFRPKDGRSRTEQSVNGPLEAGDGRLEIPACAPMRPEERMAAGGGRFSNDLRRAGARRCRVLYAGVPGDRCRVGPPRGLLAARGKRVAGGGGGPLRDAACGRDRSAGRALSQARDPFRSARDLAGGAPGLGSGAASGLDRRRAPLLGADAQEDSSLASESAPAPGGRKGNCPCGMCGGPGLRGIRIPPRAGQRAPLPRSRSGSRDARCDGTSHGRLASSHPHPRGFGCRVGGARAADGLPSLSDRPWSSGGEFGSLIACARGMRPAAAWW